MKVPVIGKKNSLRQMLGISLIDYEESIRLAFDQIEQNQVISSWKDALTSNILNDGISKHIRVPVNGCYRDIRITKVRGTAEEALGRIWSIGGQNGWYYANWLWEIRGILDQMVGGVGLRRGRKNPSRISAGEALDFWRVLYASRPEKRLLLYAEMKLPGEAWLEFHINEANELVQTATFRPLGLKGRLYWYSVLPFHGPIFKGMARRIAGY